MASKSKGSEGGSAETAPKGRPTASKAERREAARKDARRKQLRLYAVIGVGAAILLVFVVLAAIDAAEGGGDGVTDAAAWDLPALDPELDDDGDGRVRLADFAGTPTVVNFFASWCTACDSELPDFREAALALEGEVDFVFVNSRESGNWRPMVERNDIQQFALAKDIKGDNENGLYRSLEATGMPITAFYDENGRLMERQFGALLGGSLEAALAQLYGVTV